MTNYKKLNQKVIHNCQINLGWVLIPMLIFTLISIWFYMVYINGKPFIDGYISSQKDLFFYLNHALGRYPNLQFNLTHLGDVWVLFPLLSILLYYSPKFWQYLIINSLLTLIVSTVIKQYFAMPRPAAVLDVNNMYIMGKTLIKPTSLPSGHSMTIFSVISLLMIAFMPKQKTAQVFWSISLISVGLILAFSRVGVGAHYPMDVISGSFLGVIVTTTGIVLTNKIQSWQKTKSISSS